MNGNGGQLSLEQLTLFEPRPEPWEGVPFHRHSPTSRAAAASMREHARTQEARVMRFFEENGPRTDVEMCAALGLGAHNGVPRRSSLVAQGRLRDTGRRAVNPSGRLAVLWEAVENPTLVTPREPRVKTPRKPPLRHTGDFEARSFVRGMGDPKIERRAIEAQKHNLRVKLALALLAAVGDGRGYEIRVNGLEEHRAGDGVDLAQGASVRLCCWDEAEPAEFFTCRPEGEDLDGQRVRASDGRLFRESRLRDGLPAWVRVE